MVQYTSGGCFNLAATNPAPVLMFVLRCLLNVFMPLLCLILLQFIRYHANAGDGSYFDIKFLGGDGGRSGEITYYCNQQGTGISSFQYDYESPQLNYVRVSLMR